MQNMNGNGTPHTVSATRVVPADKSQLAGINGSSISMHVKLASGSQGVGRRLILKNQHIQFKEDGAGKGGAIAVVNSQASGGIKDGGDSLKNNGGLVPIKKSDLYQAGNSQLAPPTSSGAALIQAKNRVITLSTNVKANKQILSSMALAAQEGNNGNPLKINLANGGQTSGLLQQQSVGNSNPIKTQRAGIKAAGGTSGSGISLVPVTAQANFAYGKPKSTRVSKKESQHILASEPSSGQSVLVAQSNINLVGSIKEQHKVIKVSSKRKHQPSADVQGTPKQQKDQCETPVIASSGSQNSLLSGAQNSMKISKFGFMAALTSNKKGLMPSGSSGHLFKKQPADEINSSSSSSIGKEDFANLALSGSITGEHKLKNQLKEHQSSKYERVSKAINFSGKPFSPDDIIRHEPFNVTNLNDVDWEDSVVDQQSSIKMPESRMNEVRVSGQFNALKEFSKAFNHDKSVVVNRFSELVEEDTMVLLDKKHNENSQIFENNNNRNAMKSLTAMKKQSQVDSFQLLQTPESLNRNEGDTFGSRLSQIEESHIKQVVLKDWHDKQSSSKQGQTSKTIMALKPITSGVSHYYDKPQISPRVMQKLGERRSDVVLDLNKALPGFVHSKINEGLQRKPNFQKSDIIHAGSQAKKLLTQDLKGISALALQKEPVTVNTHSRQNGSTSPFNQIQLIANQHSRQGLSIQLPRNMMTSDQQKSQQEVKKLLQNQPSNGVSSTVLGGPLIQKKQQPSSKKRSNQVQMIDPSTICRINDFEEKSKSPRNQVIRVNLKSNEHHSKMLSKNQLGARQEANSYQSAASSSNLDEFNSLATEDEVNEERTHQNNPHTGISISVSRQPENVLVSSIRKIEEPHKSTRHKQSPSISNKIPNSIAFRINNHESEDNLEKDSPMIKQAQLECPYNSEVGAADITPSYFENTRTVFDEENNLLSTRRLGPVADFSLNNREELNRNIPFTKFKNMDFSGIPQKKGQTSSSNFQLIPTGTSAIASSHPPRQSLQTRKFGSPGLIIDRLSLRTVVTFFDFENIMKVMSLNKAFREGFTNNPNKYQVEIAKIFKGQLRRIIISGLTSTIQRIQFWNFKTKFFYGKKKKPNLYKTLKRLKAHEASAAEIRKDVHRTFPDISFFQPNPKTGQSPGQSKLFNILNALAQKNVKMGYIQGMNFLAGTILLNLQRGEETFWMMMSILNKYEFESVLDLKNGGRFQVMCFQLEVLMQRFLPELEQHFKLLKIPTDIYAANWFITMFCYELSLDLVFSILDNFLLEGIKSLLRVSLALLKFLSPQLLTMSFDDCMVFLSHMCQKDLELDSQTLLTEAFNFKFSNKLLKELEDFYQLRNKPVLSGDRLRDGDLDSAKALQYLKAFNRIHLVEDSATEQSGGRLGAAGKPRQYWAVLPATTEDMQEVIRRCKARKIEVSEEDILMFYQTYLRNKRLTEIVSFFDKGETQINTLALPRESENIANNKKKSLGFVNTGGPLQQQQQTASKARMLPRFISSAKKKNQKKAMSTVYRDFGDSTTANELNRRKLDSIHTIKEDSNDEFSRGGYSSTKNNLKTPIKEGGFIPFRHSVARSIEDNSPSQKTATFDYRSIQIQKSVIGAPSHTVQALKPEVQKIIAHQQSYQQDPIREIAVSKSTESPFQQFGSRIKSIFGNIFKVKEKMNRSQEEAIGHINDSLHSKRSDSLGEIDLIPHFQGNTRSKSIYRSMAPVGESSDILILDSYDKVFQPSNRKQEIAKEEQAGNGLFNKISLSIQKGKLQGVQEAYVLEVNSSINNKLSNVRQSEDYIDDEDCNEYDINEDTNQYYSSDQNRDRRVDSPDFMVHRRRLFPDSASKFLYSRRSLEEQQDNQDNFRKVSYFGDRQESNEHIDKENSIGDAEEDDDPQELEAQESGWIMMKRGYEKHSVEEEVKRYGGQSPPFKRLQQQKLQ